MRTFAEIVSELLSDLEKNVRMPTPEETKITVSQIRAEALFMQNARGYKFSECSIKALADLMKGYGLFVCGNVGVGKTFFFKALRKPPRCVSMLSLMAEKMEDVNEMMDGWSGDEIVLDDVGAEPSFNHYGVRLDLLPWLVEKRMESVMRTHFTTNLCGDELAKRYGVRIVDRIREMCKLHRFDGPSRRTEAKRYRV